MWILRICTNVLNSSCLQAFVQTFLSYIRHSKPPTYATPKSLEWQCQFRSALSIGTARLLNETQPQYRQYHSNMFGTLHYMNKITEHNGYLKGYH